MPYSFNLPLITDMTDPQQAVLDEPNSVAITGGPGTGKSVVSLWRHVRNYEVGEKNSLLLTYTKTLTVYLKICAERISEDAAGEIKRSLRFLSSYSTKRYGEIIVDEAQDLGISDYDRLTELTDVLSYGADDQQILYPERASTEAMLEARFPNNVPHELDENFRNSHEIMLFVQAAFPGRRFSSVMLKLLSKKKPLGITPKCMVANSNEGVLKALLNIIEEFKGPSHNIGVLLPLQRHVNFYYELLRKNGINCTCYYYNGREIDQIENIHVTTFKSSKGIEFDTVILPDFDQWKNNISRLNVVEEKDYYVAFTRAKINLFLISNKPNIEIDPSVFEIINI